MGLESAKTKAARPFADRNLPSSGYFTTFFSSTWLLAVPVFTLVAGGSHLTMALVYTLVLQDGQDQDRYVPKPSISVFKTWLTNNKPSRATIIARFETILQISQLASPVLGAALMSVYVFLPMMVALPLTTLALPLILFALPARSSGTNVASRTSETEPLLVVEEEAPTPGSAERGPAKCVDSIAQAEGNSSRSSLLSCPIIIGPPCPSSLRLLVANS